MYTDKFVNLSDSKKKDYINDKFIYKAEQGWFTPEGEYAGADMKEVIEVLIDLEDAEINSIGDCMSGMCVSPPKLSDFVRKR